MGLSGTLFSSCPLENTQATRFLCHPLVNLALYIVDFDSTNSTYISQLSSLYKYGYLNEHAIEFPF